MTIEEIWNYKDFLAGLFCGLLLVIGFVGLIMSGMLSDDLIISEETGQDICANLYSNNTIEFNVYTKDYKLICEIPTYDNTQNILFKENEE